MRGGPDASYEGLVGANDVELRPAFEVAGEASFIGAEGCSAFHGQRTEHFDDWALRVDGLRDAGEAVLARVRQTHGKTEWCPSSFCSGLSFDFETVRLRAWSLYMTVVEALEAVELAGRRCRRRGHDDQPVVTHAG